jgi:hypothetical protein
MKKQLARFNLEKPQDCDGVHDNHPPLDVAFRCSNGIVFLAW